MAFSKGASRYGAKSNLATSGRTMGDPPNYSKQRVKGDQNRSARNANEAIHLGQTAYVDKGGHTVGLGGDKLKAAESRRSFLTLQNYLESSGKPTQYED